MTYSTDITHALDIGPDTLSAGRTVDITTTGAKSGEARRIEIWFWKIDGHWYLTGNPGKRAWYANILAHPAFTFHLKNGVQADLAATAVPITDDAARQPVFAHLVGQLNRADNPGGISKKQVLQEWLDGSPLAEIHFTDM